MEGELRIEITSQGDLILRKPHHSLRLSKEEMAWLLRFLQRHLQEEESN